MRKDVKNKIIILILVNNGIITKDNTYFFLEFRKSSR